MLYIKLLIETKPIVCLPWEILHYKIVREKLEPEPGFEPLTSGFLARRSATSAILVLMPAPVQMSLLRRMPLSPGDAVMTLSVIIFTTSELTSPFYMNMIFKSSY